MIQLPFYEFPFRSKSMEAAAQSLYVFTRHLGNLRAAMKRRSGAKVIGGDSLPHPAFVRFPDRPRLQRHPIPVFSTKSNGDLPSFVFATK